MSKHGSHAAAPSHAANGSDWVPYGHADTFTGSNSQKRAMRSHQRRHSSNHHGRRHRHVVAKVVACVLVALVVALGACGYLLYRSATTVKSDATAVMSNLSTFETAAVSGDSASAATAANTISTKAADMKQETSSPLWKAASYVPVYGSDVSATCDLVDVLDDVAQNALLPVSEQLPGLSLSKLIGDDGSIDVATLQSLATVLSDVSPVLTRDSAAVDALPETHVSQITSIVSKVKSAFSTASSAAEKANQIAPYLSSMLGGDGQDRTYLIIAQGNSEIRATGGFPGSWGTMTVSDGHITLGDFTTIAGARPDTADQPSLTDEEVSLFGVGTQQSPGSANFNPDFPRSAEIMSEFWQTEKGQQVDGIIAIDPVFLQSMLGLVGGVTAPDGTTVDGTNAAKVLLSTVYWDIPVADQDAYFASVADSAFSQFFSNIGKVKLTSLASLISDSASDHRLQVWMRDASEESAIDAMGMSGALSTDETTPVVGVYVNDDTWAKMCWYLGIDTKVGSSVHNADGSYTYKVTTTLSNSFTKDIAASAPEYVYGYSPLKRSKTDMITHLYLYAPAGGSITDVQVSGGWNLAEGSITGFDVWSGIVQTEGGESTTVSYSVTTSTQATQTLSVRTTPDCEAGW
ncbi:MAG: DUF4012 domain-containing protein [Atopobiaceae bacterium]|nr:DUF4012 domain-containing protein [Atopobiaceae bacterium]